jgi:hypothetical protein
MSMNKNQKFVIIIFVILLLPILGMFYGNYDYSQAQPGQNKPMIKIGLFPLLGLVTMVWLFFLVFVLYFLKGEENEDRKNN